MTNHKIRDMKWYWPS